MMPKGEEGYVTLVDTKGPKLLFKMESKRNKGYHFHFVIMGKELS